MKYISKIRSSFYTLALVALVSLSGIAKAQDMVAIDALPAGTYELDKSHASVTWKVSHFGLSDYTARFTDLNADVTLNPQAVEDSSLRVSINPMSVRTDYPFADKKDFDKVLSSEAAWFNAGEFGEIAFVSKEIETMGDDTAKLHGELTLLGVTKPLTLDVMFNGAYLEKPFSGVPAFGISATTVVKRSEWGMGSYVPNIGDDVEVLIEAEFHYKEAHDEEILDEDTKE